MNSFFEFYLNSVRDSISLPRLRASMDMVAAQMLLPSLCPCFRPEHTLSPVMRCTPERQPCSFHRRQRCPVQQARWARRGQQCHVAADTWLQALSTSLGLHTECSLGLGRWLEKEVSDHNGLSPFKIVRLPERSSRRPWNLGEFFFFPPTLTVKQMHTEQEKNYPPSYWSPAKWIIHFHFSVFSSHLSTQTWVGTHTHMPTYPELSRTLVWKLGRAGSKRFLPPFTKCMALGVWPLPWAHFSSVQME